MARPRSVDRESLLDAAEAALAAKGLAGLSFGAVASASGVAKATVQSVFGHRDALIAAVLDRWLRREQARFEALAGPGADAARRTQAHIRSTAAETPEAGARMATLLSALASAGEVGRSGTSSWYAARAGDFTAATAEERRLRLAFLAAEGAFYVRHLAGVPMSEALWTEVFADILALAREPGLTPPAS
jgi:AcrR family transcriptional regulator